MEFCRRRAHYGVNKSGQEPSHADPSIGRNLIVGYYEVDLFTRSKVFQGTDSPYRRQHLVSDPFQNALRMEPQAVGVFNQ